MEGAEEYADDPTVECRLCGPCDLSYHPTCPVAEGALSESDERVLLDLLNATPRKGFWPTETPDYLTLHTEHNVGGWKVCIYWKAGYGHWQYIEWVESPDGQRYESFLGADEHAEGKRALPHVVAYWKNRNRLSYDSNGDLLIDRW